MGSLEARTALVTGAGQGIGRAVALRLAAEGAAVVVNDLDPAAATRTVEEIEARSGRAVVCSGSVAEPGFADRFVRSAVDTFGGLDIIVNNAGFTWDATIQNMTDEQWDAMFDVHVKAPFRILRAAQPVISRSVKRERALGQRVTRKIVNITSVAGTGGAAGMTNYSSAKAAVVGLTLSLAKEWGRYDVTVNAVGFGLIRTRLTEIRMETDGVIDVGGRAVRAGLSVQDDEALVRSIPLGRAGTPEEAANAVYLLCGPDSDYVTGEVLICGGGFHF